MKASSLTNCWEGKALLVTVAMAFDAVSGALSSALAARALDGNVMPTGRRWCRIGGGGIMQRSKQYLRWSEASNSPQELLSLAVHGLML